jgi:lactate dehydrogenase-like 2-hydroxyacid dehydrogenase
LRRAQLWITKGFSFKNIFIFQQLPPQLKMHHHIVGLEAIHIQYPEFTAQPPNTVTLTSHITTTPSELKERVKDATIIIATTVKITAEILSAEVTPRLQAVAVMAAGTDHVDLEAAQARGIAVFNCPHASSEVVANHAIGLYFAARRKTVLLHNLTVQEPSEWKEKGSIVRYLKNPAGDATLTVADEICGIIGYGAIGKISLIYSAIISN